ncbi:hypothetical protein CASFOL_018916 [Castilleja foliolosa]|uniref:Uncharacterized protein n=1 Tax=Castilleja foliolosa TaxID=1961234 RepID=A0ABD3D796_9LAMI
MSSPSKRRDMDVMKLMMSDYTVEPINDGINEFNVEFHGPKETVLTKAEFGKSTWNSQMLILTSLLLLVFLTEFTTLTLMNSLVLCAWTSLTSRGVLCLNLLNVFEVFLPQLLLYPNPSDPLNGDAASLMMKDKAQYELKVKEYCERYAKKEHISNNENSDEESDEEFSDGESHSDDDVAGRADL